MSFTQKNQCLQIWNGNLITLIYNLKSKTNQYGQNSGVLRRQMKVTQLNRVFFIANSGASCSKLTQSCEEFNPLMSGGNKKVTQT